MKTRSIYVLLLCGFIMTSVPAQAEIKTVYRETSPTEFTALAEVMDIKVTSVKRRDGRPSLNLDYGDYNATVVFYNCAVADQCGSMSFSSAFSLSKPPTEQIINDWNDDGIFSRAHLSKSGRPVLTHEYSLRGGFTSESLAYTVLRFKKLMESFVKHLQQ